MIEQFIQKTFWDVIVFGNPVHDYVVMLGTLIVLLALLRYVQHFILKHLRAMAAKTETDLDDTLITVIESLRPPFYFFLSVYLSSRTLILVPTAEKVLSAVLILWVVYQIIVAIEIVMEYAIAKKLKDNGENDDSRKATMGIVRFAIRFVIWSIGVILALSNLDIDVTSLVAGLGIGGIAIVLAAQNILGDLFSSFAIHFDKPFVVGDYIVVGTESGTVEKIGLKTTRLRGTQGEELIISNKELTTVRIQNFKKMTERRIIFTIGLEHSTDGKKLREIPVWIKEIIENESLTRFDRSHFKKIADSSLEFETVYFISSPEYPVFMDIQQNINLAIHEKFAKEKVTLAFPTQTIHTVKG